MKKLLFITNIPAPYRIDFFNELSKYFELTVAFEGLKATDRNEKWKSKECIKFKQIILDGVRIRSDAFLSFKVIPLLKQKWDFIIQQF